jgi:hypothetical protein
MSNVYDELVSGVIDVKDLGSGVMGGIECDHFAFRKKEVDFEIWIAQGERPWDGPVIFSPQFVNQMVDCTGHINLTIEIRVLCQHRQCLAIKNHLDICKPPVARCTDFVGPV